MFVNVCVRALSCLCVRVCAPLPPGFNTLCMQRLTTLPSNHILLSGRRRQQQQVVRPIGVLWSGKKEKGWGGEKDGRSTTQREKGFIPLKTIPGPYFKVALQCRVTGALQSPLTGGHTCSSAAETRRLVFPNF